MSGAFLKGAKPSLQMVAKRGMSGIFYNGRVPSFTEKSSTFSHALPLFSGQIQLLNRCIYTDSEVMSTNSGQVS